MEKSIGREFRPNDYRLNGNDTVLAIEKGLTNAAWYTSPVPREIMQELRERRDGPAIRDSLLWFALLFVFGSGGYLLWGSWWAVIPFAVYGVLYASGSDSRWHESLHGTAFKTDWMNNYHVALSQALPEDEWQSHEGFIHEVLKREYLDTHPDPTNVDYFLCGPPAMIQAATVMLKHFGVPPTQIAYDEF